MPCHLLVLVHCFLKSTVNAAIYQEILEHFMLVFMQKILTFFMIFEFFELYLYIFTHTNVYIYIDWYTLEQEKERSTFFLLREVCIPLYSTFEIATNWNCSHESGVLINPHLSANVPLLWSIHWQQETASALWKLLESSGSHPAASVEAGAGLSLANKKMSVQ